MGAIRIEKSFVAPVSPLVNIEDEGVAIVSTQDINFVGAGVAVTENPAGTAEVTIPGVRFWTESESAATAQNTRWTPNNVAANVSAVVQPKGTGANLAQRPDGTSTGGNARGIYATDFQKIRTAATQIASGNNATITGGTSNTASGTNSVVSGSQNTASGANSTVIGGDANTASGSASIAGGASNTSSANSSVALGNANTATATGAVSLGVSNVNTTTNSFVAGQYGKAYLLSQDVYSAHLFRRQSNNDAIAGGCQISNLTPYLNTTFTTGQINKLSLDGTGTTNLITPTGDDRLWNVQISYIAVVTLITGTATGITVGDHIASNVFFSFKKIGGVSSISAITTVNTSGDASITGTAVMNYTAGAGNDLELKFTAPTFAGGGSITMRINAKITLLELAY